MAVTSTTQARHKLAWQGIGLVLVSAAALCFEINLTRLFSVSQFYHFAFMVVSIALLGYGVSGTFLALQKGKNQKEKEYPLSLLAGCAGVCILGSFLLVNTLSFDSYSIAVDITQLGILILHYAALSSPFFFIGMITSLMLRRNRASSGKVYALNLAGSAAGCLVAILAPGLVDGEGVVALSAVIACLGGLFFMVHEKSKKQKGRAAINLGVIGITLIIALVPLSSKVINGKMPEFFTLKISPYKSISYALQNPEAEVISSAWNSISKIDVVRSPSLHSLPGLSYRYTNPLPPIKGLFWDGDNLNPILPPDNDQVFASHLQPAIAFELQEKPHVLILEPQGGIAISAALAQGAGQITAVEGNPLVIDAAADIYHMEGVDLVTSSGRSFLRASETEFDIIQIPLTDSFHPVSSGAYALGEDYRYTLESFEDMIKILKPDGLLVITRWLQQDPSEWLRIFALAVTALEEEGLDPTTNIIALRGYNTGTIFVKNSPFDMTEIAKVRSFAEEKAFDIVIMPMLREEEINRFNILPKPVYYNTFNNFLQADSREFFYRTYPYDVSPPTDDHPFFGHYFKWSQIGDILGSLGNTWQPFGGAGYLAIIIIFIIALILSGGLILLPTILRKQSGRHSKLGRLPIYFGLIGLAFMLVEMPLIQRFILYLDQPAFAMAAVLFSILLFSGIGSHYGGQKLSLSKALLSLVGLLVVYMFLLPRLLHISLGLPLVVRLLITIILIAPAGFLMGIPFPSGLSMIGAQNGSSHNAGDWMISFVWAVNGASSVIATILASLISLSYSFNLTFAVGTFCYLLAFFIIGKTTNIPDV
ncbi:MAG: hypothetical protein SVP52_06675 [Chloroflexota bacterium]|nr:hypothetical protein [Chloroflexota bacterium]